MGLETATYVGGLTAAWPLSGDLKAQGDDHIRLLKVTLQATFPNATKPFYFPTAEAISGTLTLDATDHNNTVIVDTSGGSVTVNLPSGFSATEKGWECRVVKLGTDTNAAIVTPASGTITAQVGAVATVRVGVTAEPATFFWSGTTWICWKPGMLIGSVMSFDGGTIPAGHLDMAGATYSNTAFAELFAVLATTTLRDRRGRTDIGDGTGTGLTARTAGTNYGAETVALDDSEIPTLTVTGSLSGIATPTGVNVPAFAGTVNSQPSPSTGGNQVPWAGGTWTNLTGAQMVVSGSLTSGATSGTGGAGGGVASGHANLQPSIAAKRIIRAC